MADLLPQVRAYARRHGMFAHGQAVVAGVSGGPDSLCLLHLLTRLARALDLRVCVAHLNHGLRGAESDADAEFVRQVAADWGWPCAVERADVAALAAQPGVSVEEAAREARYAFLARVAVAAGTDVIAVGHHADDQAETVLMHFLRGSGVAGLRGMLPVTELAEYRLRAVPGPVPSSGLYLVRPLLGVSRAAITDYCREHELSPRTDSSNADTTYYRNRLRHELLPLLEIYNPAVREVLAHTAAVMAGDHEVLAVELSRIWARVMIAVEPAAVTFDLTAWRGLSIGLQRATVREAIHRLRRSLRNINWEHVEAAVWLAREGHAGQAATLAAGLELQIGYDTLRIADEAATPAVEDAPQVSGPVELAAPGLTELAGGWRVSVGRFARADLPPNYTANADGWSAWLDADAVGATLTLRPRVPGDRLQPLGMGGHTVRLNELMINLKTPRHARAGWPILAGRAGIAWACGLRVDERAAVREDTLSAWQIRFMRDAR
jgi:tRNA(Ile)-lysidine synthase